MMFVGRLVICETIAVQNNDYNILNKNTSIYFLSLFYTYEKFALDKVNKFINFEMPVFLVYTSLTIPMIEGVVADIQFMKFPMNGMSFAEILLVGKFVY